MNKVVLILLVGWLALSFLNQSPRVQPMLMKLNALKLLPFFSLFAPDPIDTDCHLLWRDIGANRKIGPWNELSIFPCAAIVRALWNPCVRELNSLQQVAAELDVLSEIAAGSPQGQRLIILSVPYLVLLSAVSRLPHSPNAERRQFMVVNTRGFGRERRVEVSVTSEAHDL
jgi:hypothetical protein